METLGFLSAVVIGLTLGLTGGGGSILTVPALVYLFHLGPVEATAYSLFIVGFTSLAGATSYFRKGLVDFKTGLIVAIPAFFIVFSIRKYVIPHLPEEIINLGSFVVDKDLAILGFFSVIMVVAGISMVKSGIKIHSEDDEKSSNNTLYLLLNGIFIGIVTGIAGAGGGFLIVPALVLLAHMPVKNAIGTSLFVIVINSLIGFLGDLTEQTIDWKFLLLFTLLSIAGIIAGSFISAKIESRKLRKGFGWFVLAMGVVMATGEFFKHLH